MSENGTFSVSLRQIEDFQFEVRFEDEGLPPFTVDESEPVGKGRGPNPSGLLAVAVGNCLSASLLFCLRKSRIEVEDLNTDVTGFLERNEAGRLRVARLEVQIRLHLSKEKPQRVGRCIQIFEDYCVVTASIRKGIPVNLRVTDQEGTMILEDPRA